MTATQVGITGTEHQAGKPGYGFGNVQIAEQRRTSNEQMERT